MNLATLYSPEHDYASGALARFAGTKIDFSRQFDLLGQISQDRPIIRTKAQMRLWQIINESKRPLKAIEIYGCFESELDSVEKSGLRQQLSNWTSQRFLIQLGKKVRPAYALRSRMPKL